MAQHYSTRSTDELLTMIRHNAQAAAYTRGECQARNVMRTLGMRAALADLRTFLGLATVPAAYTAGYCDAVMEAVQR